MVLVQNGIIIYFIQIYWVIQMVERRDLLVSAAGAAFFCTSAAVMSRSIISPGETEASFRDLGGKVVSFFYGGWTQWGNSRNPSPWFWINSGFKERLPIPSVNLPGHWLGWSFDQNDVDYTRVGDIRSAYVKDARITFIDGTMHFEPTGRQPAICSPNFHAGLGSNFPAVKFSFRLIKNKAWRCKLVFTTWELPNINRFVDIAETASGDTFCDVTVDLSKNNDWMSGNIKNISLEIDTLGGGECLFRGRLKIEPSSDLSDKLLSVKGLPQNAAWAADWQQQEASRYGIDVFMMCTFWDGEKSSNSSVVDAMFASKAAPNLELGLYFDSAASAKPSSLKDFDNLLYYWNNYFSRENYWTISGKPVLGWHGGESTRDFWSGIDEFQEINPTKKLKLMVDYIQNFFRSRPDSNAKSGLFLLTGFMVDNPYWSGLRGVQKGLWEEAGFDAGTVYNQFKNRPNIDTKKLENKKVKSNTAQNFAELNKVYQDAAEWIASRSGSKLEYFMPAIAGWDVRPWSTLNPRERPPCSPTWQCTPTPNSFENHLMEVRGRAMKSSNNLNGSGSPFVVINAWDEFGEGSFLCPSQEFGYSRLISIKEVFGIGRSTSNV